MHLASCTLGSSSNVRPSLSTLFRWCISLELIPILNWMKVRAHGTVLHPKAYKNQGVRSYVLNRPRMCGAMALNHEVEQKGSAKVTAQGSNLPSSPSIGVALPHIPSPSFSFLVLDLALKLLRLRSDVVQRSIENLRDLLKHECCKFRHRIQDLDRLTCSRLLPLVSGKIK